MDNEQNVDVMLICKGWYNKQKYEDILGALNAYYHKNYGCEEIQMDKAFTTYLFLKPLALEAIKRKPTLAVYLYEPSFSAFENKNPFYDVMYKRTLELIQMIPANIFDTSKYDEMIEEVRSNSYNDDTVGVI